MGQTCSGVVKNAGRLDRAVSLEVHDSASIAIVCGCGRGASGTYAPRITYECSLNSKSKLKNYPSVMSQNGTPCLSVDFGFENETDSEIFAGNK